MKPKKIAFIVTSINSGGIENYLLRFLRFSNHDIAATVYCKSGMLGDLEQEYVNAGATLKPFKLSQFSIKDFLRFKKELKGCGYVTVVDFTGNFAALPLLMAKHAGISNRVVFYRGSTNHFKEDFFRLAYNNFLNKLIPKVATSILSNSEAALHYFFKNRWQNDNRFKVIYNGIDANTFLTTNKNLRKELNIPDSAFVVGHVGRFNSAKNHKTMIQVAINMCKENANVFFVFCGDKVVEGLNDEVQEHKLESQIKLLGFRKDVINVLNTLNCFYFPSLTEGQPNALIEAMIAGLPFVASDIAPIKETVPSQFHSQLIPAIAIEEAKQKIEEIKNKIDKQKFVELGFKVTKFYDAKTLFTQFYNIINKHLS